MSDNNLVRRAKSYIKYIYLDKIVPTLYPHITKIRARISQVTIVHVVGDSHTQAFNYIYPFIVHHLGATTAYNLGKVGSATNSKEKLEQIVNNLNPKHESILLVFGEIDCRIHIYNKFCKLNKEVPIINLIRDTIRRYGMVMNSLKAKNIDFYVLSVTPASKQGNIYNYPYYASFKQRADIHKVFNEELSKYCLSHGYSCINLYREVVDKSGGIKPEFTFDKLHINYRAANIVKNEIIY